MSQADIQSDLPAAPADSVRKAAGRGSQRRPRRRGRGKPPAWTIWLATQFVNARTLCTQTFPTWVSEHREQAAIAGVSLAVHFVIAVLMALWVLPSDYTPDFFDLIVTREAEESQVVKVEPIAELLQPDKIEELNVNSNLKKLLSDLDDGDTSMEMNDVLDRDLSFDLEPTDAEMESVFRKGEFGGRSKAGKQAALKKYGGTAASEKAVSMGLRWLQSIQQEDGSWHFRQVGAGAQPGAFQRTEVGATSLALLCFLGAGHTHFDEGPYKETVAKGLAYIGTQAEISQGTADLRGSFEGNAGMYVHGLATICISEAHALDPRNKDLQKLTGMAVGFIEKAQNPFSGGWRYTPRSDDADTSVAGWQIMALHSAKAGRVRVSSKTMREAREFLREAQTDRSGAFYCYNPARKSRSKTMTAVGLLCRMYLGWKKDHEGLQQGVAYLAKQGPDRNNMYYNYYATQVLRHWGGKEWDSWNKKQRSMLVSTQITEGPAAGSWPITDNHGDAGGQIYQTALSILTLEVYYRHLPIYRKLDEAEGAQAERAVP
ncbi:MAG: terpene cyclase/mutase family protein [Planctomycetaceae bacterium]|nr:terpene cyclase/mutase family protein [Planctomycetaceae bacterium]